MTPERLKLSIFKSIVTKHEFEWNTNSCLFTWFWFIQIWIYMVDYLRHAVKHLHLQGLKRNLEAYARNSGSSIDKTPTVQKIDEAHNSLSSVYDKCGPVTAAFTLGSASVSVWLHGGWTFHVGGLSTALPYHYMKQTSPISFTSFNAKKCKMVSTEVKMVAPSLRCKTLGENTAIHWKCTWHSRWWRSW
jgi:hypothetical protein